MKPERPLPYDSCACGDAWCRGCSRGEPGEPRVAELPGLEVEDAGPWLPSRCTQCGQSAAVRTVGLRAAAAALNDRQARSLVRAEWAPRASDEVREEARREAFAEVLDHPSFRSYGNRVAGLDYYHAPWLELFHFLRQKAGRAGKARGQLRLFGRADAEEAE